MKLLYPGLILKQEQVLFLDQEQACNLLLTLYDCCADTNIACWFRRYV